MIDELDDLIIESNKEQVESAGNDIDVGELVVYSRDWTVQTILHQIEEGNIDLNPDFQRRNVWDNDKRSKLIESLLVGYPVPEVVLAEVIGEKKKYMVIDGKQRLLAINGFIDPSFNTWDGNAKLRNLTIKKSIEGLKFSEFSKDDARFLLNADLRCTILSGFKDYSVLYDIFYRLNTGSSPLSMQELRNSIYKGDFSNFITRHTDNDLHLHKIMKLKSSDKRYRDVEILLKFLALNLNPEKYNGSLRVYLDNFTKFMNDNFASKEAGVCNYLNLFNESCEVLVNLFDGEETKVGRKWLPSEERWESRFNRTFFEVLVNYIASTVQNNKVDDLIGKKYEFIDSIKSLFDNAEFVVAIESTTTGKEQHVRRFRLAYERLNSSMGLSNEIPSTLR